MKDFFIIAVIVIIISLVLFYIFKSKKKGKKCIGCPDSFSCNNKNCSCCYNSTDK